jgi:two-component system, sensor histidine kinase and response regulator
MPGGNGREHYNGGKFSRIARANRPCLAAERVERDQELLTEMIHLFQEDALNLLAAMRDSLQRGDMAALERSAHSLKGAAGNLSAKATAAAALQLENDARNKDAESAKESLVEVERALKRLLPALAELCQGVTK